MEVYYCTDHDGVYPTGVASIVVAPSENLARIILRERLRELGLDKSDFTLQRLYTNETKAIILVNGDY